MRINDDFAIILDYISKLFAIKHLRTVDVHEISVSYVGKGEMVDGIVVYSTSFPEKDKLDRLVSMDVSISKLRPNTEITVSISFDKISSEDCNEKELRQIIDIFDRSTFRFF